MDSLTASIVTGLTVNYFSGFTQPSVNNFFAHVFRLRPELEWRLKAAKTSDQLQQVYEEVSGMVEAAAANGSIDVDGGLFDAIRRIQFDHQRGTVTIGNAILSSNVVVTGGVAGSTGTTVIAGGAHLKSAGTKIKVGTGASIKMTGGASISQT